MRVPTASVALLALLALQGVALARAPVPPQNPPAEQASPSSELVVPADSVSWQTLAQNLFASGESSVGDPGRLEPLARHMLKLGPVDLLPKLDQSVVYDDNVFLTKSNKEADFISRTGLGLLAEYPFGGGMHHVSAGYDMLRNHYLNGDAKNFVEQFAAAQIDLGFKHLKVTVGDRYEDRTDPILVVFSDKIERTINTAHGFVGWHDDSWYGDLRAQRVSTAFDDVANQVFDRDEDLVSLEVGVLAQESTWAFVRADVFSRAFDNPGLNDGDGVGVSVGARLTRGDELDAMVRVGARSESFDDNFATDADDSALNAEVEGRVRWWFSRSSALDARVLRTTAFSPISNYEIDNLAEIGWLQQIDARLSARGGVGIEQVDPSNTSETFIRYTIGAGARYALLDNADLTLNWRLRMRTTDAATGEYTGNQVTLGFAIRL